MSAYPEQVHALLLGVRYRGTHPGMVVLRQVLGHGHVDLLALFSSYPDGFGIGGSQIRMVLQPPSQVLGCMNHDRPTTLARLVDPLDVHRAQPARLSPEQQEVEGLGWVVFPALADPEGERGFELLGAVLAGSQGFRLIR